MCQEKKHCTIEVFKTDNSLLLNLKLVFHPQLFYSFPLSHLTCPLALFLCASLFLFQNSSTTRARSAAPAP